jgi:hypothetical protein
MLDRSGLSDGSTHGCADEVGALEAQHIQQADGIRGHVRERIGHRGQVATEHRRQIGRGRMGKMGRPAHIAVVEPNQVEPALHEGRTETIRPSDQLRRQSLDEQHRRRLGIPQPFVRDIEVRRADVRCHVFVHIQEFPWRCSVNWQGRDCNVQGRLCPLARARLQRARGPLSTGKGATATCRSVPSIGKGAIATGRSAPSIGKGAIATGRGATATCRSAPSIGRGATATCKRAPSSGRGATATCRGAPSIGRDATATCKRAPSIGRAATATCRGAPSIGKGATATCRCVPSSRKEFA